MWQWENSCMKHAMVSPQSRELTSQQDECDGEWSAMTSTTSIKHKFTYSTVEMYE